MNLTKNDLDEWTYKIIGSCIEVHRNLGAGLLESVYQKCLEIELKNSKLNFETELIIPINYKGNLIESHLRADFVVEKCIVLEIKSVSEFHPIFDAKILTYMKLLKVPKGILVNFNSQNIFHEGQKTFINEYFRKLPE